jgi:hypothetical protein
MPPTGCTELHAAPVDATAVRSSSAFAPKVHGTTAQGTASEASAALGFRSFKPMHAESVRQNQWHSSALKKVTEQLMKAILKFRLHRPRVGGTNVFPLQRTNRAFQSWLPPARGRWGAGYRDLATN